jgi:hypothetical protein
MKKATMVLAGLVAGGLSQAEPVSDVDRMVCVAQQVQICIENDSCYTSSTWELNVPEFVVIDLKKKKISTTKASEQNRSTPFTSMSKSEGLIYLQGFEGGRAFSFVIDEATGRLTVAVARDGIAVNVFGACTATDL